MCTQLKQQQNVIWLGSERGCVVLRDSRVSLTRMRATQPGARGALSYAHHSTVCYFASPLVMLTAEGQLTLPFQLTFPVPAPGSHKQALFIR